MSTVSGDTLQVGTQAAMREQRSREALQAMREYQAERLAILAKSDRLRALRLANEAQAPAPVKAKKRQTKQDR